MVYKINNQDIIEYLKSTDDMYHAVLSDPPYGLAFMGKAWDKYTPLEYQQWVTEWGKLLLDRLYPGAVCMFFGGTRTYHRLAIGLEDAGFEIFDSMIWCYGSGFPKSHNISKSIDKQSGFHRGKAGKVISNNNSMDSVNYERTKLEPPITDLGTQWDGYGTALKPAYEPIVLCRKPRTSTFVNHALENGTGALNIDGGRIETNDSLNGGGYSTSVSEGWDRPYGHDKNRKQDLEQKKNEQVALAETLGRFPANFALICECEQEPCECIEKELDSQSGNGHIGHYPGVNKRGKGAIYGEYKGQKQKERFFNKGGASRFFYTAKANRKERNLGLDDLEPIQVNDGRNKLPDNAFQRGKTFRQNSHPTVKPLKLTEYLAKLLLPPTPDAKLLVPFSGSGSEIIGASLAGWSDITGVELNSDYVEIAEKRLVYWLAQKELA